MTVARRARDRFPRREVALLGASVTATLLLIEGASALFWPEARRSLTEVPRSANEGLVEGEFRGLYRADPRLGWLPNDRVTVEKWGVPVSTLENGLRGNGRPPRRPADVLVVGDSYTFGDEVPDADTWPAQLEESLGRGVANGGVSSFGLDQMVLRAEDLLPLYRPRLLVAGLIGESLSRAGERVRHSNPKPYFGIDGGALILRNTPVPARIMEVPLWRRWAARSYVASLLVSRFAPRLWWRGTMWDFQRADNDTDRVGPLLLDRLVAAAHGSGAGLVVVLIDTDEDEGKTDDMVKLRGWLERRAGPKVRVIDTLASFMQASRASPTGFAALSNPPPYSHLNRAGNRLVAEAARGVVAPLLASEE